MSGGHPPEATDRPSLAGPALTVAAAAVLCAVTLFLSEWLPVGVVGFASDVAYQLVAVGTGVVLVLAARPLGGRERFVWSAVGVGVLFAACGDVLWSVYAAGGSEPPYPGPPDAFYLAAYPLWFAAALGIPYAHGTRYRQARLALDAVVVTVTLAGITWTMLASDLISLEGQGALEVAVGAAYPLMDAMLVVSLLVLSLRRRRGGRLRVAGLVVGLALTAVADLLFLGAIDAYEAGTWFDGLWVLAYGCFALSAYDLTRPAPPDPPGALHLADHSRFAYVVFGVLVVASAVTVATDPLLPGGAKTLLLVTGVVAVAVVIRVSLGIAENRSVLERERQEMIAAVSHELRTPLTAIQGFVDLMAEAGPALEDDERSEMLATVQGQTRGLTRIVSDLIEVSRDQLMGDRLSPAEFELASVIDEALTTSAVRAEVDLEVTVCRLAADRQRIVQVVVNLLTNAARYGHGRILVEAGPAGADAVVRVHDNGPGVPTRYRELIWERFERGSHQGSSTPGTGIGLSLVRALVEAHGGRVAYQQSARLGGACFVVRLPRAFVGRSDRQLAQTGA